MAKSKFVKANDKIAEHVVSGYKKIEDGVVNGYQKVELKGHDFIPGSRERRLPCLWYRHVLRADLAGKVFPEGAPDRNLQYFRNCRRLAAVFLDYEN